MLGTELLMNIFGIIVAILVLSILVAVHEAGHLLMAKWSNIRVDVFSIGMGKPIWGFQYGETYYQIGRLPFGGFCGFGDEENGDKDDPDPRALMNSPLWARLLTVIGGSLFNIIFAYLMMVIMFQVGFKEQHLSNQVAVPQEISITDPNINEQILIPSPAYNSGLRSKDIIIDIDNNKINHFMNIPLALTISAEKNKKITYIRDNNTNSIEVDTLLDPSTGAYLLGIQPISPAIVSEVIPNTPAQSAGLQTQDKIIAINGQDISFFSELIDIVKQGKKMNLTVVRKDITNKITISPIQQNNHWMIGVKAEYPQKIIVLQKASNIFDAFKKSYQNISELISHIVRSLHRLFSGKIDIKENISGPVRIVSITGDIAQTLDFSLLVKFMTMLSLALAIFNMLPFPGLDGGAIILQTARSIFKDNQIAEQIISWIEQAGIILLLAIAVFVLFNDVKTLTKDKKSVVNTTYSND